MTVAVIGAGQIGRTVAHAICESEPVILIDSAPAALASARDHIRRTQAARMLRRASVSTPAEILGRMTFSERLEDAAAAEMVIENVTEDLAIKLDLHKQLDSLLSPQAAVAVNTSVIPITTFEAQYADPTRLVGLHFMNPATEIRAVEMVPSRSSSPERLDEVRDRLRRWGFRPLEVRRDTAGFVINRILMQVVNEAAELVDAGVADAHTIDELFTGCLGHRTGPLATADLIGLDTVVASLATLEELTSEAKFRPSPLLLRLVHQGHTGRKAGTGFHHYAS